MPSVIQIRGVTGSGKTSAVRYVLGRLGEPTTRAVGTRLGDVPCTYSGGLVAVGDYNVDAKCAGADRVRNKATMMECLRALMSEGRETIVFDSMIYSTTYRMAAEAKRLCEAMGYGFRCVCLDVDFDTALSRVYERNGGKPINHEKLVDRCVRYEASKAKLVASGVEVKSIDAMRGPEAVFSDVYKAVVS